MTLLAAILIALIGFYQLQIRNEQKKLQDTYSNVNAATTTETTPENKTNTGRIVCIGDSLTLGIDNVTSYPSILSTLTKHEVVTYGGASDTSLDLSLRLGTSTLYTEDILIPSSGSVELYLYDEDALLITPFTNTTSTPVTINGIAGELTYLPETGTYSFTRTSAGQETSVEALTRVEVSSYEINPEQDIVILFIGSYDSNEQFGYDTIENQNTIIDSLHLKNYVIIGLTSISQFENIDELNGQLLEAHGDAHFLDVRDYILTNATTDTNIVLNEQDQINLEYGYLPSSLFTDDMNGSEAFNRILANQLITKMVDNKYLTMSDLQPRN